MKPRVKALGFQRPHFLMLTFSSNEGKRFSFEPFIRYPVYRKLEIENFRGTARIEVLDALGKLIYAGRLSSRGIKTRQEIDIRHVSSGIYTLRLQTQDGPKNLRLRKE